MTICRTLCLLLGSAFVFTGTVAAQYILGPRGGCYTLTRSGSKRYVDRSLCQQEPAAVPVRAAAAAPVARAVPAQRAQPAATSVRDAIARIEAIERELAALKASLRSMEQ